MASCFAAVCAGQSAWADPCDALYAASIRSLEAPHRVSSTTAHVGKTRTGEAIYAGGVEYIQHAGASGGAAR